MFGKSINSRKLILIAVFVMLSISMMPSFTTVIAECPPGKGKPHEPKLVPTDITFSGDIGGDVSEVACSLVDGRLTFARANTGMGHCPPYTLIFNDKPDRGFWSGKLEDTPYDFDVSHQGVDLEMTLWWSSIDQGTISFRFWFKIWCGPGEFDYYRCKIVGSGAFKYDKGDGNYAVTLDKA